MLHGQQLLYAELRTRLHQLGGNKTVIFNGIRCGQNFAGIPNLLPYADGGEMEGWMDGEHQRFPNGTLNPAEIIPTFHALINASRLVPEKEVLLKPVPGGGTNPLPSQHWSAATYRQYAFDHYKFPLAAFLIVAGPRYLMDYTYGYRSYMYVPPIDGSGAVPGVPTLQSYAPQGWYPDFLKAPGTPRGPASFDGMFTFTREWTGVSVSINVQQETATIVWK